MKLENQVCSLELAKRLKELGVKQESLWWWTKSYLVSRKENDPYFITQRPYGKIDEYSAFTVAELGEMLPQGIRNKKDKFLSIITRRFGKKGFYCGHSDHSFVCLNEANARAKMLIYLKENKLI